MLRAKIRGELLSFSPSPAELGIDPGRPPKERYRILGQIASGGMSEIYLAQMESGQGSARQVALKRLRPELQLDQDFVGMFYDEARIASQMEHPNIVRIFELGELDGSLFIAMELVAGVTLRDALVRLLSKDQTYPIGHALRIACEALEALDYAHHKTDESGQPLNIVHRDISPQNILISYDGDVKLLDFGVAKAERKIHQTMPGLIKGKFGYMAPEQVRGDHLDGRADLFALGETLYEAAVGTHPFPGTNDAAMLASIMHNVPSDPKTIHPEFPEELARILLRALEKDPKRRYLDAKQMRGDICEALKDQIVARERMGEFIRELYADAYAMLEDAREHDDLAQLVESLRIQDFAERSAPSKAGRPRYYEVSTEDFPRTVLRVVDSEQDQPVPPDSADLEPSNPGMSSPRRIRGQSGVHSDDLPRMSGDFVPRKLREPATDELRRPIERAAPEKRATSRVGRYAIVRYWKRIGVTEWFLAKREMPFGLSRQVVLKRLAPEHAHDQAATEELAREARILLRLEHPNVIRLFELGSHRGEPHLVTEWIDGWTLREVLDRCSAIGRELPISFACRIAGSVASALFAMHNAADASGSPRPIVHREIHPDSIWISEQGAVKIADFGAALEIEDELEDIQSDIRGAGAILQACTPGSADAKGIVYRALSTDARDRFATAHALEVEIERLLFRVGQPVTAQHLASWLVRLFLES